METGIKSSFIPRDAGTQTSLNRPGPGLADLMILISIVLFVASAALGIGVFLYLQFLQTSSSGKLQQLERAKQAFEPSLIQELTRLDDRMRAADQVLSQHIAPTLFFHLLEAVTLQTVAFQHLDFQAVDSQNINIKLQGIAASVNSIALQADYLSKSGMIESPIFSNINRQQGGVKFDLSAIVNPMPLRYSHAQAAQKGAPPPSEGTGSPFESQGATPPGAPPGDLPSAGGGTPQ